MPGEQSLQTTVQPALDLGELRLKNTVFLAYTDVAAVGRGLSSQFSVFVVNTVLPGDKCHYVARKIMDLCIDSRALLGLNMRKEYYTVDIPEISKFKPACIRDVSPEPTEYNFQAVQVLNCKYEQEAGEFSVFVVNTVLPGDKCHYVARKIMDLCIDSHVEKVILLTSLHVDVEHDPDHPMLENTFNTQPVTSHPALPGDTKICDPFLSTMIQMIQIEGLPCNILTVPGYRVLSGKANTEDGTQQMISIFQETLEELTNLRFDRQLSLNLVYRASPDQEDDDMATMMYI